MNIKIIVEGSVGTIHGPFPMPFLRIISALSGRKIWKGSARVTFDAIGVNLERLKATPFAIDWEDKTGDLAAIEALAAMATQQDGPTKLPKGPYHPAMPLYGYQNKTVALSADRDVYAHLHEMGLGKTAIMIYEFGRLHQLGKVTGVLILTRKGVHAQWLEEEVPKHISLKVTWHGIIWKANIAKRGMKTKELNRKGLTILSMNIDAIRTEAGFDFAENFLRLHNGKTYMAIDESQDIKSHSAERTKASWELGQLAAYRRISTGTPLAKNVMDAWSQFKFLDVRILGHRYVSSFRARYCIMGGFENREIVGQRNVEEFYQLIAPHSFRTTKAEELDLPPKVYVERDYELSDATKKKYKELKKTFMVAMDNGSIVDVTHAASALLRLQQIVCGYLPDPDNEGHLIDLGKERIKEMMDIIDQVEGPVVIWARFREDVRRIEEVLKEEFGPTQVVTYTGSTSMGERKEAREKFLRGQARFFVSIAAAGGTGNNLQGKCRNVIYYSNDFNALSRWQSEDRTHRIGTEGSVTYFDLIARGTIDRHILRNLKMKKSMSDLTLDQIRAAIAGTEEF